MTIAKGRLRSGPEQLAAYVMGTDDGQRATLLNPAFEGEDLHNTFLLFDALGSGRTEKTLYHGQICPRAKDSEKMTVDDWLRAVEIYAEKLGMAHHPRRVILHEGRTENPHVHVVIQRYDPENDKLWHPSFNYVKHERASLEIALEFGHEIVPGKHVKRDRKKQPEFPRGETNQAQEQQAARTSMTVEERKEEITALRKSSDSAQAFKNALEEAGYILAKGAKRGFVLVDENGEVFSLSKHVTDIKGKEYKAFMASLDEAKLPSVEEAKAIHAEQAKKAVTEAPEQSKFLTPESPSKVEHPAPEPPPSKFLPDPGAPPEASRPAPTGSGQTEVPAAPSWADQLSKFLPPAPPPVMQPPSQAQKTPPPPEGWTEVDLKSKFQGLQPPAKPPEPPPLDPEITRLREAIFKRQQREYQAFAEKNAAEYKAREIELQNSIGWKMEDFDAAQYQTLQDRREGMEPKKGWKGFVDRLKDKMAPETAEARAAGQREEFALFRAGQAQERRAYALALEQANRQELADLRARHLDEQRQREKKYDQELTQRLAEKQKAIDLAREQSEWEKGFKKEQEYNWDDPDRPPEKGK